MEANLEHRATAGTPIMTALPTDRGQWPEDASAAVRHLQRELDLWSSEHGWTRAGNEWIAEEAVRRGWYDRAE